MRRSRLGPSWLTSGERSVPWQRQRTAWSAAIAALGALLALVIAAPIAFANLPDGRAYELVSPVSSGEPYLPPTPIEIRPGANEPRSRLPFQASLEGAAITYVAEPAESGGTGETGPGLGNQWLAARTSAGWRAENITPSTNLESVYQAFAPDLSNGIYEGGQKPPTPEVESGCPSIYRRSSESGVFSPLFTHGQSPKTCGHPLFAGATENESEIIFQSQAALTPDAEPVNEVPEGHEGRHGAGESEGKGCMFGCNLYAWSAGQLKLVNVLEGVAAPNATFGGYAGEEALTNFSNAISRDGSRIFWTDTQAEKNGEPNPAFEHVYVLENGTTNIQVSEAGPAEFWTATPDGRFAYYTEAGELWRFDTSENTREVLTTGEATVRGVIGTNQTGEDGAYIYFVANGVLAANENAGHETAVEGQPNVYVVQHGVIRFIATLSEEDNEIEAFSEGLIERSSDWRANVGERIAQVTPDGLHLIFQSVRSLTGYDNEFGVTPAEEVFNYFAEDAELDCVSCNPTGAPLTKREHPQTKLPEAAETETYLRRWVSENGNRVFFDSEQRLVPQDTNEAQDVYEWEREGEGTCQPATPVRPDRGCVFLLSGGSTENFAFLVDADTTGENVFFENVGSLAQAEVPEGRNALYDARVGGGFAQPTVPCGGSSCQPTPTPAPNFTTQPSTTFSGGGNFPPPAPPTKPSAKKKTPAQLRAEKLAAALKVCRRDHKRAKRIKCEKSARKKYGTTKAKAGKKRRAH